MTDRTLTVGLLWHSLTSDNLGVGALTLSQIAIVERIADAEGLRVRFLVLGWQEPRPAYGLAQNVDLGPFRTRDLYRPGGFAALVRRCDLVLDIGAGDSFSDIYGAKRFGKYATAKAIVHALRRPLVLSPQTIGPFKANWARRFAMASLRRSAAIFARDEKSVDILRADGFSGELGLASDVALKLPYAPPSGPVPGDGVRVGINVSGLLMNGGYTGGNMFGLRADYPGLMRRLIERFASMDDVTPHLVAHVISDRFPVEDDYRACEKLAEEFPGTVLAPRFDDPCAAKSYIAGMDFFIGARMHACIAAFSAGVPVVPMAYSRKFEGLFGALDYSHTVDCTTQDDATIETAVMEAYARRDALAEDVGTACATGLERLGAYETALAEILRKAARAPSGKASTGA